MSTVVWVRLEVDGEADNVFTSVDEVLDAGFFQDAINDYWSLEDTRLRVTSAVSYDEASARRKIQSGLAKVEGLTELGKKALLGKAAR